MHWLVMVEEHGLESSVTRYTCRSFQQVTDRIAMTMVEKEYTKITIVPVAEPTSLS